MAVRKTSMRYWRWLAAGAVIRAVPPLRRAIPFYRDTATARDAAEGYESLSEHAPLTFTDYERVLVDRLPHDIPWQRLPETLEREIDLLKFSGKTLLGDTGNLVDEDAERLILPRTMRQFATYHNFRGVYLTPRTLNDGPYVSMLGSWRGHRHLFHFMLDRLPRLFYLLERFALGRKPVSVIVHADLPRFQRDVYGFIAARYPNVRFVPMPENERWRISELYLVDNWQNAKSTLADPEALAWMRDLYLDGYGIDRSAEPDRRIYVSREDTKKRQTTNETEVRSVLARYDVEPVLAGPMSFEDQVRTFARSDVVVGTHGAGLTNILFSPQSLKLLEIFPEDKLRNTYHLLSRSQGQAYRYVFAGRTGARERFHVPAGALEQELRTLLNEEG